MKIPHNKKIQRTRNKRGLLLALVGARAADLGRWAANKKGVLTTEGAEKHEWSRE